MMWYYSNGMGWWMVFGVVLMIIFWGGLIGFAVWGIRRWIRHDSIGKGDHMEIAKHRYAKGEITKQEYEQIKKDLTK